MPHSRSGSGAAPLSSIKPDCSEVGFRAAKARIADVVEHLGVSRRLADLRFHEIQGRSISAALEERRLSEVKRLLATTSRSIRQIAIACGYANPNRLSHVFTQRYGISMRLWRHEAKAGQNKRGEVRLNSSGRKGDIR